jgi:hypothetical protein
MFFWSEEGIVQFRFAGGHFSSICLAFSLWKISKTLKKVEGEICLL